MSRHRLRLVLSSRRGALVRALSLVERRGFRVSDVASDGSTIVTLCVEAPERSFENLCHQLTKLVDVVEVGSG